MMATKIKKMYIKGLRGIKNDLTISLDNKSILLYGDNGTGKSSIADALEWFYCGKIGHLCSEEIGKAGLEGLRNISLPEDQEGEFQIEFSNKALDCSKVVELKKGSLKTNY